MFIIIHPGLQKPAPAGGPGSDIINMGLKLETMGGQKLGTGWFLIPSALVQDGGSQLLAAFYRNIEHFIKIMVSFFISQGVV